MSRVLAVVPVRGSSSAKTRLAALFTEDERLALVWAMLRRLVDEIEASGAIERTLIVTRDELAVRNNVEPRETLTVLQQGPTAHGLNGGLEVAREWALVNGYDVMLVMPGDLPLASAEDIRSLIEAEGDLVVAADRGAGGTNAIRLDLLSPKAREFRFRMGLESLQHNLDQATRLGLETQIVTRPNLAHDLDVPEDWADLVSSRQRQLLEDIHESLLLAGRLA